jgi:PAS domain S-box-containing protein
METYSELKAMEDEPVILADEQGMICSVNRCFEETFRWPRAELKGQLLTVIMPETYRDSHSMGISRFLTTESRTLPEHALELDVLCGDGTVLKSSHTIVAGKYDGAWMFAGKIVPLSQQARA